MVTPGVLLYCTVVLHCTYLDLSLRLAQLLRSGGCLRVLEDLDWIFIGRQPELSISSNLLAVDQKLWKL